MNLSQKEIDAIKTEIVTRYYDLGIIHFSKTVLTSSLLSPTYIDNRMIISYPDLYIQVTKLLSHQIEHNHYTFDYICGIPIGGYPLQFSLTTIFNYPSIMLREKRKNHATKKIVEGVNSTGKTVLIIDDVITTGKSALDAIKTIEKEGFIVNNILTLIDAQQGASNLLSNNGYLLTSVFKYHELLQILEKNVDLTDEENKAVQLRYVWQNQE